MTAMYTCCDERRRSALLASGILNGIDFLEVDDLGMLPHERQRKLVVHFVTALNVGTLTAENVRILGGERIRDIAIDGVDHDLANPSVLTVRVSKAGDFSPYVLRLVRDQLHDEPPPGIDPILSAVQFSFKVECPSDLDCVTDSSCPVDAVEVPPIDYLAKDYASFRRLMLDRIAVLLPSWRERSPADVGIALVELLAYVGDQLSYYQDAVATEAYLSTARRRVSVRRHARLVDYAMHDGCNARVWAQVHVQPAAGAVGLPRKTQLLTAIPGVAPVIPLHPSGWTDPADRSLEYRDALGAAPDVFETMHDAVLRAEHADLRFYTWGSRECCLPKGTTAATLRGAFPHLRAGDVLVLAERLGPVTGATADADPAHRHAVRLTSAGVSSDPLGGRFAWATDDPVAITEIRWHDDDALPFALCVSAKMEAGYVNDVSHALGNIVLADHGLTVADEKLGTTPKPSISLPPERTNGHCKRTAAVNFPPRFRPSPRAAPVTQAAPYDPDAAPASATATMRWEPHDAMPAIVLHGLHESSPSLWSPVRDLLGSDPGRTEFVVEVEDDGTALIRFGDDRFGRRPSPGTSFSATYRVGNGTPGNVGAASLAHVAVDGSGIAGVTNPLPALGGIDPESSERVRQNAPAAFRIQERAVTLGDYGEVAGRRRDVQRAAATLRWTGSWRTVFVTMDRAGGGVVDDDFRGEIRRFLDIYRMAGQDVDIDRPEFVALELELFVCLKRDYFRSDVEQALRRLFSNRTLPDGGRGLFHPDNFTFGQPVYLSRLVAAAQAMPGVDSVEVKRFRRQGLPASDARASGVLKLARLEIARLDQDPDFPEHGRLALQFGGGR